MKFLESLPTDVPIVLLQQADPSIENIHSYLDDGLCYVAKDNGRIVAVCIVQIERQKAEIQNISVLSNLQGKGIGGGLLRFTIDKLKQKGVTRVELGTGSFGYQLTFYQRAGFRVHSIVKDHFLKHYADPIIENGIQHKDMIRLYLDL